MLLVGLTGGIASGKSTVSSELRRRGFPIIDCDEIAHATIQQVCLVLQLRCLK